MFAWVAARQRAAGEQAPDASVTACTVDERADRDDEPRNDTKLDAWADMLPADPPPSPRPVPGTEAGYVVATVSRGNGRITGLTHAGLMSEAEARHEMRQWSKGSETRVALCRVEVLEVNR